MTSTTLMMDEATASEAADDLEKVWWLLLVDGIISLVIGFLVLSWKEQSLFVLAYFLGAWLCVVGVIQLISGIRAFSTRWPYALTGVVALGAGIATLVWPHVTLFVLAMILGWTLLLWGIFDVVGASLRHEVPHWWIGLIKGVVLFALGIWAVRHPGHALTVSIAIFGIACVFWGAMELVAAFFARHARKHLDESIARAA
jgi:uncharacterized membrane protein HdeD (DUF308 family)